MKPGELTRKSLLVRALPIMGANIATPLVGVVDITVIGNSGDATALAAVALGTVVFNSLFWSLGFLRMGSTALAAQADGDGQPGESSAVLWRALGVGGLLGLIIVVFQQPIRDAGLWMFSGDGAVETQTAAYIEARVWSAPAALAGFGLYGWLIGMGLTGRALILQIILNLLNIAFSCLFVLQFNWGVSGVAAASALAQWLHLVAGLVLVVPVLRKSLNPPFAQIIKRNAIIRLLSVNRDIFLRTLALLAGFYWFNEASVRLGADILAGNAILLQFIMVCAFFLDAFAHITEAETGRAAGAKDWPRLMRAFRLTSELAAVFAVLLGVLIALAGTVFIEFTAKDPEVRAAATAALLWCALAPIAGWPSFQLDGLMIGTTRGALMRNAMVASLVLYLIADFVLRPAYGLDGLWAAFVFYYVARAGTLALGLPGLKRDFS